MHPALLIGIEFSLCAAVIGVAGIRLSLLLTQQGSMPQLGHISLASLLILAIYPVGMRARYLTEQRQMRSCITCTGVEPGLLAARQEARRRTISALASAKQDP